MSKVQIVKESCQICAFERVKKTMVSCPKCNFICCKGCVKKFLLESTSQIPTCMNCKVGWDLDFISDNTDQSFHNNEYRVHRAKIILSLEKSLLPSTQEDVNKEIKKREIDKIKKEGRNDVKKIDILIHQGSIKKIEYFDKYSEFTFKKDLEKANEFMDKWVQIRTEISNLKIRKENIQEMVNKKVLIFKLQIRQEDTEEKQEKKNPLYIGPCPQDECKGYLDIDYKCGLCKNKVCKRCRMPTHENDCNKDVLETIKMLDKETKPCPKCKAPIFKIDGCDQIWCTSCHTAFSWNTGQIESGKIHNPHYYQWMRENGGLQREQGDVVCGEQVDFISLIRKVRSFTTDRSVENYLTNVCMNIVHIRQVLLNTVYPIIDRPDTNKDLRVRYMIGDFDEKKWLSQLKSREKVRETNRSMNMLLTMGANVMDDLIRSISICDKLETFTTLMIQLSELNDYINANIDKIENRFKVKLQHIEIN
jgi:hypothetical protein